MNSDIQYVQISFKCQDLRNTDMLTKSDPRVKFKTKDHDGHIKLVGTTEVIQNSLNPVFSKTFKLGYVKDHKLQLLFEVEDEDDPGKKYQLIGGAEIGFDELLASNKGVEFLELANPKEKNNGTLVVFWRRLTKDPLVYKMDLKCKDVKDIETFSKSDPYLKIMKPKKEKGQVKDGKELGGDDWELVYRTEHKTDDLNPDFGSFTVDPTLLCNNNAEQCLKFQIWDYAKGGEDKHEFIGEGFFTLAELKGGRREVQTVDVKGKNSGLVILQNFEEERVYFMEDFMKSGLTLALVAVVDYSSSTGDTTSPSSLHFAEKGKHSRMEEAITAVGDILFKHDTDQRVPIYGFGASFPSLGIKEQNNFFRVTGKELKQQVATSGKTMAEIYKSALPFVNQSEPSIMASSISGLSKWVSNPRDKNDYLYCLALIFTDGHITDIKETIDALVVASKAPISIIIVGVGEGDMKWMSFLDGDGNGLRNSQNQESVRDLVEVIEFSKLKGKPTSLERAIIDELPAQILAYFKYKQIKPK